MPHRVEKTKPHHTDFFRLKTWVAKGLTSCMRRAAVSRPQPRRVPISPTLKLPSHDSQQPCCQASALGPRVCMQQRKTWLPPRPIVHSHHWQARVATTLARAALLKLAMPVGVAAAAVNPAPPQRAALAHAHVSTARNGCLVSTGCGSAGLCMCSPYGTLVQCVCDPLTHGVIFFRFPLGGPGTSPGTTASHWPLPCIAPRVLTTLHHPSRTWSLHCYAMHWICDGRAVSPPRESPVW